MSNRRAWIRTRLTNILCCARDEQPVNGWVLLYQVLGSLSTDQLADALTECRIREKVLRGAALEKGEDSIPDTSSSDPNPR